MISPAKGSICSVKEKTKLIKKSYTELNNLVPVQEIKCGSDAVWVIKFRIDGAFMATGGKDGILRIWKCSDSNSELSNFRFSHIFRLKVNN